MERKLVSMTDNDNVRSRICEDCGRKFRTLTRFRSHNCPNGKAEGTGGPSLGSGGGASYSGIIETWLGKTEVSYAAPRVPNVAQGEECTLCGNDAADVLDARIEWIDWLCEERDMTPPFGRLQLPLCVECYLRVDMLNEGEKEYGMYGEDAQTNIEIEREEILGEITLDTLNDTALEDESENHET
jgi:hypothetical protein